MLIKKIIFINYILRELYFHKNINVFFFNVSGIPVGVIGFGMSWSMWVFYNFQYVRDVGIIGSFSTL